MSSDDTGNKPQGDAVKVNAAFNNPSADVRLASSDGEVFYIESFYLQAGSDVFRGMLSSDSLCAGTEPVQLCSVADD
ncbi:hypothetical protein Q5752_006541 [Cryptotrichosporon argae]